MATVRFDLPTLTFFPADMPALTGSPKQVAWAENLRIDAVRDLTRTFEAKRQGAMRKGVALTTEMIERCVNLLASEVEPLFAGQAAARFWIDNRAPIADLVRKARG